MHSTYTHCEEKCGPIWRFSLNKLLLRNWQGKPTLPVQCWRHLQLSHTRWFLGNVVCNNNIKPINSHCLQAQFFLYTFLELIASDERIFFILHYYNCYSNSNNDNASFPRFAYVTTLPLVWPCAVKHSDGCKWREQRPCIKYNFRRWEWD